MSPVAVALFLALNCLTLSVNCEKLKPNGDCNGDGTVCEFRWKVHHTETMVLHNETTKAGEPVVTRNGIFYKRILEQKSCTKMEELTASELERVLTVDGSYRPAIVINGEMPGPPIIVREGTQVVVHVTNDLLMEGIAIHWHGMVQRNTPWMDGVGMVSHCPINPGETFTYRFLATPPGTHWYHSHYGTQRTDGLYGALIVLENEQVFADKSKINILPNFDGEFILILHDWMRNVSLDINQRILQQMQRYYPGIDKSECFYQTQQLDGTEIGVTPFVSGLINGKGHFYHFMRRGIPTRRDVVENQYIPLERFNVVRGQFYRFRMINAAMMYSFRVAVDRHDLHVMSVDGNYVHPTIYQSVIINSGERFDFYIETTKNIDNYWIRASTLEVSNVKGQTIYPGHVEAVLHYDGALQRNPTSTPDACISTAHCEVLNCPFSMYPSNRYTDCKPLTNLIAPSFQPPPPSMPVNISTDTAEHFINFHFTGKDSLRLSSVNGRSFVPPSTPPMILPSMEYDDYMEVCDEEECKNRHCSCTNFLELTPGHTIQITLHNRVQYQGEGIRGTAHPVHFHGHHFYVMKIAYAEYDANGKYVNDNQDIDCGEDIRCNNATWSDPTWGGDNIPGMNLLNPPMKDTVIVPVGGYAVIRFKADNPGWWFVHCHIEIHQVEGMAMMLKEGTESQMSKPPSGFPTCGNYYWSEEEFNEIIQRPIPVGGQGRNQVDWSVMVMVAIVLYCFQ